MNRSIAASSKILSLEDTVDRWSQQLTPHFQPNIQSTIKLINTFNHPIIGINLLIQKLSEINNKVFVQTLKSIIDQVEILCQNAMISNLHRLLQGKSIIASTTNLFQEVEEKNIYKGSFVLLNLIHKKNEKAEKSIAWNRLRQCAKHVQMEDDNEDTEDNHQLMKFFQGVRQYQSYQEELGVQAIEKIKKHKDNILKQKAVIQGFNLSRWEILLNKIFNKNKKLLFTYFKRSHRLQSFSQVSHSYQQNLKRNSFNHIINALKRKSIHELFQSYKDLIVRKQLLTLSKQIKSKFNKKSKLKNLAKKLIITCSNKQKACYFHLLSYLKSLPKPNHLKLLNPLIRITNSFLLHQKRRCFKKWKIKMANSIQIFTNRLQSLLERRAEYCLNKIESDHIIRHRPMLSYRAKGKIVASIIRVRHQQNVNIKKYFLKWWLKAKPVQVEKRFMHMFLHAPTRPFTYFLRLKNMVKQSLNKRPNAKSILFALFLKQKNQKFLKYRTKDAIDKWHQWNRLLNKIVKMNNNITKMQTFYNEQNIKVTFKRLLEQFDQFNNKKRLMIKIFNVIGNTSIGKVMKIVDIWKKLPNNADFRKRRLMLNVINKGLAAMRKQIKDSFQKFKDELYRGEERKRAVALIMIKTSSGGLLQSLKKWQDSMRINKTMKKCRLIGQFLQSVTQATSAQYSIILESSRQAYLKQKYLMKLIQAQTGNISRYISIFHGALKAYRMKKSIDQEKRKFLASKINSIVNNQSLSGVKGALHQLYRNYKVKQKQVNFMNKIMQTKFGRLFQSIKIWKDLPQKEPFSRVRNGHKFFSVLKKISDKGLIYTFKGFVLGYEAGEIRKRGAMGVLLAMSSSDVRKYYIKWHSQAKKIKTLEQCKLVISNFESLRNVLSGFVLILFQSRRISQLKQKCFNRMMENLGGGLKLYLRNWLIAAKKLKFNKDVNQIKQQNCINILSQGLNSKKSDLIKLSIKNLHKNMRIRQISKAFFNKLLDTQSGKIIKAIQIWNNLPNKDANRMKQNVLRLFSKLLDLAVSDFRFVYHQFKNQHLYGESRQKYVLNKLVNKCMSYQQKKIIHWKSITKQLVLIQKTKLLSKAFQNMNNCIADSYSNNLFSQTKTQMKNKQIAIVKLVKNNTLLMKQALMIWKQIAITRCYERYDKFNKLMSIFSSQKTKSHAFNTIKQYNRLQQQRVYINSLWKWKTSQLESDYYNKFIMMLNQSEVLTIFSKTFNTKLTDSLQTAFSALKQNREQYKIKSSFVKKYFLRKLSSYFDKFKDQIKGRQIKRWRSKYQISIKGILMLQALQKAIRKIQSYELRNWSNKVKRQQRKKEMIQRLAKMIIKNKQTAWNKLNMNLKSKRIIQGLSLLVEYKNTLKKKCFDKIHRTAMLMKLVNVASKKWRDIQIQFIDRLSIYSERLFKIKLGMNKLHKLVKSNQNDKQKQLLTGTKKMARYSSLLSVLKKIINKKQKQSKGYVLSKLSEKAKEEVAIIKIKAAHQMYNIYQNIHHYVVHKHFTHWKKMRKESVWLKKGIEMFATKPSIKSTLAISLWRLKVYSDKKNKTE